MAHPSPARGFTLVETLIATGVLVTALAGLAQLFAMSVRLTRDAGQSGVSLMGAQDKLESLRALRFGYDDTGEPVTDARLDPSPATALTENAPGYVDWLDVSGVALAEAAGAEYVRRWRVTAVGDDDPSAIVIDVCVFHTRAAQPSLVDAEACLATARVRQP
jgi:Tfp pilus assembly protein PilV